MDRPAHVLTALGLHRPDIRAWAMYDLANSAFSHDDHYSHIPGVFHIGSGCRSAAGRSPAGCSPARRRSRWRRRRFWRLSSARSPTYAPIKKRLLGLFTAIGCVAAGCLALVMRGDWFLAAICFGIGNVGFTASLTFYDSLLPHIAREGEIDRISTGGYRARIPRRRHPARGERRMDSVSGDVRPARRRAGVPAVVRERRRLVARVLDSAFRRVPEPARARGTNGLESIW